MATPAEQLDLMLRDFDYRTTDGRSHPGAILRDIINSSPELKSRVLESIEKDQLDTFNPLRPNSGAGGTYDSAAKSIQLPIDNLATAPTDKRTQAELVFVMGHEIQHSFNRGFGAQTRDAFDQQVKSIAQGPSPHDYTEAVSGYVSAFRTNEASAHIGGFNAVVSHVQARDPNASLGDVYSENPQRMRDFIEVSGKGPTAKYTLKPGLDVDDNMHMPATDRNVASMSKYYFDKALQNGHGLGDHKDQTYRDYYTASALARILKIEEWAQTNAEKRDPNHPRAQVQLDTKALGVNAAALHTGTFFKELGGTHAPAGPATPLTAGATSRQGATSPIASAAIGGAESPLYSQAVAALDRLGPQSGIASSEERRAVAAAMAVRAQGDGLQRIDLVVSSTDGKGLIAVEGNPASPISMRSYVDRVEAASQPADTNLTRLQPAPAETPVVQHAHALGISR